MVGFRNLDIPLILNGKEMTGRPVDFKIKTGKWHTAMSVRIKGGFGKIFVDYTFVKKIGDLSPKEIKMLGYSSIEEYLSEPYNKGLTEDNEKLFIHWSKFKPNWKNIKQILG